jgi:hypothetical protein
MINEYETAGGTRTDTGKQVLGENLLSNRLSHGNSREHGVE